MKIKRFKEHVKESVAKIAQAQPLLSKEIPDEKPVKSSRSGSRKKVVTVPKWVNY
jgi:hypothetical protein